MALGAISFGQGIASGIDFKAIVDVLIRAQSQPIFDLQDRNDQITKAKSAFSSLDGLLGELEKDLKELKSSQGIGGKTATFGDATAPISVSALSTAASGTYDIEVTRLATSERRRSAAVEDRFSPLVTDGTITIQAGENDPITINVAASSGNNSLQAVADTINGAKQGVLASVVNDGTGSMLILKSTATGADNALTVTDSTNLDLGNQANILQQAQDAELTVDGVAITSKSNSITTAIEGVTLTLRGTTDGVATLNVEDDVEGSKQVLRDFVAAYNKINDFFQAQFGSAEAQRSSAIASDGTVRRIQSQLANLLAKGVSGVASGNLSSLAVLGIEVEGRTGRAVFDETKFSDLVDQGRFDEVKSVLLSSGSTSDPAVRFVSAASTTQAGEYAITITTAAERADAGAATAVQGAGITADETLTINYGSATATVDLTTGDTIDAIVTKVNESLRAAGISSASAYSDNGALRVRSSNYGSEYSISIVSDTADAGDGTTSGIGTTTRVDAGVDVAGTINGVAATGGGQSLTASDATDADGLTVRVYATAESIAAKAGNFGTIGFSQGASDAILAALKGIRDPFEGAIKSVQDAYSDTIEANKDRIERISARLEKRRESLTLQFSAAEQSISQLQGFLAQLQQGIR